MKIVIVGGGSAGWMTASTLIKEYPTWDITLYESPMVGSLGVGESTTQYFRIWTHFLGIKDEEWMPYCDATYKSSVKFHNFHSLDEDDIWHYPFGVARDILPPDAWFYLAHKRDWKNGKFARDYYISAECAEHNKLPLGHPDFDIRNTGFHFDAVKFAEWLKVHFAMPRGVKHRVMHVLESDLPEADLYFDCTGFRSLLNDSDWVDYSDYLPNNKALATRLPYRDKKNQLEATTYCKALSSGWCWKVPTWSRIGTGYNYCDKYISDEEARLEFIEHLRSQGHNIKDDHKFRLIPYKTGRKKEVWKGNVVSIGMSGGFVEPLESNGLLSVHSFLMFFTRVMSKRKVITQFMRDTFNNHCNYSMDGFASFVAMHYAMTQRDDSPYWRAVTEINYPYHHMLKDGQITFLDESYHFHDKIQWANGDGIWCAMAGNGWNPFNSTVESEIDLFPYEGPAPDGGLVEFLKTYEVPPWEGIDKLKSPYDYYTDKLESQYYES